MKSNFRIQNENDTFFGTGSDIGRWFTLERARQLCDYNKGQRIIEICPNTHRVLWEIF